MLVLKGLFLLLGAIFYFPFRLFFFFRCCCVFLRLKNTVSTSLPSTVGKVPFCSTPVAPPHYGTTGVLYCHGISRKTPLISSMFT